MKSPIASVWNRKLWGVAFHNGLPDESPRLLGSMWDDDEMQREQRASEPTRTLLFCTRKQARAWCNQQAVRWAEHSDPIVKAWRVRPVRVRETVEVIA